MTTTKDTHTFRNLLYEFLFKTVNDEGGDGDGVIISENYKEYAKEYNVWQEQSISNPWKMEIKRNSILFSDDQADIIFCNTEESKSLPEWLIATKIYLY